MAITFAEDQDSREWSGGSCTLRYTARGSADDVAVKAAFLDEAPETYNNLPREAEPDITPEWTDTVKNDGCWKCSFKYSPSGATWPVEPLAGYTFSFNTGGSTQHITHGLQTVASYAPAGKTAPDFKGAIGVTKDSVEGVDIDVSSFDFTVTWYKSNAQMTQAYISNLCTLTNKVNNSTFTVTVNGITLSFPAGEVRFRGASGSKRSKENDWEITGNFSRIANRTNFTVGDITVASKKGWEYMWVRYKDTEDGTARELVKQPVCVKIEKVYEDGTFSF